MAVYLVPSVVVLFICNWNRNFMNPVVFHITFLLLAAPVDGHWGRWSSWATCSKTCGNGTKVRTRKCDDPPPLNSGKSCPGDDKEQEACILRRCGLGE